MNVVAESSIGLSLCRRDGHYFLIYGSKTFGPLSKEQINAYYTLMEAKEWNG